MADSRCIPVEIRGVTYPSMAAAARALGVTAQAIYVARMRGTMHRAGTGRVGIAPMCVRIAGQDFENAKTAAAHFKVTVSAIYAAINDGDPDRIARPQVYNPAKSIPFSIGGVTYPSRSAASREFGFEDRYINEVIRRGSKRGYERILQAAMRKVAVAETVVE